MAKEHAQAAWRRAFRQKAQQVGWCLLALLAFALVAGSIVIQNWGGKGSIPTWKELYGAFGLAKTERVLPENVDTAIHFINVGQGDATLLQSAGHFALVDAGTPDSTETLLTYLEESGVKTLDFVVMTHPHADHIGGMLAVLRQFPTATVILPDFAKCPAPPNYTLSSIQAYIEEENLPTVTAAVGQTCLLGSMTLTVVADGVKFTGDDLDEGINDLSVMLRAEARGISCILGGDSEKAEEMAAVAGGQNLSADIYKADHHGSYTSSCQELLDKIKPKIVVVSCGADNSYGHPHTGPMERFAAMKATVYRTDEDGTVVAAVTEYGLQIFTAQAHSGEAGQAA